MFLAVNFRKFLKNRNVKAKSPGTVYKHREIYGGVRLRRLGSKFELQVRFCPKTQMYKIVSRNNTRAHTEYGILYGILHLLKYAINSNKRSNKKKLYHIYDWGDLIFICFSSRIWFFYCRICYAMKKPRVVEWQLHGGQHNVSVKYA